MDGVSEHMNGSGGSQAGSSGRSSPSDPAPNKMFVGGLSWQTTPEKLREYFGTYGNVRDVLIMKDPVTQGHIGDTALWLIHADKMKPNYFSTFFLPKYIAYWAQNLIEHRYPGLFHHPTNDPFYIHERSRGFGFITFGDASSVEKVIGVPNHILDGKKIDPKHATPKNKGRTNRTKKIFVGGVSQETSADEVKQYFSQFGKVEEAVMLMDNQTKRHRGFGFVTFESEDVVERVCEIHFHTVKNKKVECKKAQPKEAVQAAAFLSKRLMIPGTAGLTNPLVQAQAAQVQAAAIASAQAAALSNYGKLVGGSYPPLSAYRYAPYPLPAAAAPQQATHATQIPTNALGQATHHPGLSAVSATHTQTPNGAAHFTTPGTPTITTLTNPAGLPAAYPSGYSLTNVDMSSFQGVDWSAMYGVGMYA